MQDVLNRIGKYWLGDYIKELVLRNYLIKYEACFDKINNASYEYFHEFFDNLEKECIKELRNKISCEILEFTYNSQPKELSGLMENIVFNMLDVFHESLNYYSVVGKYVDELKQDKERYFLEKENSENFPSRKFALLVE